MSKDLILAIDNGTQSVRALLFDPAGNLIAKARVPIEPYFSTTPGSAEQDPEVFWQAVCQACQSLWKMPGWKRTGGRVTLTAAVNGDQCRPGKDDLARRWCGSTSGAPKG
jgi:glycerol kinase